MQKKSLSFLALPLFGLLLAQTHTASAQALPAATRSSFGDMSVFAGVSGTSTGFAGSNTDITTGFNFSLPTLFGFQPAVEIRGTYPVARGSSASEKDFLAGPLLRVNLGRLHPYVNFLFGRGLIEYPNGYSNGDDVFISTSSAITSPGGGFDFNLSARWLIKADVQFEHWDVEPSDTSTATTAWARTVTGGIGYRFDLGDFRFWHHGQHTVDTSTGNWHPLHEQYPGLYGQPAPPPPPQN